VFVVCGRYTLTKKQIRFASRFSTEELQIFLKERYNIAPTQAVPIIHIFSGKLVSEEIRWGLQPTWSKTPIINAQCEGILNKPTFRQSVLQRRCLMPADGFYEWQGKTPFHFTFPDAEQFFFGGIIDTWTTSDKPPVQCCSIITTAANEVVSPFHKRMPFILAPADYDTWLDPATKPEQLEHLFKHPNPATLRAIASKPLIPDGTAPPSPKPTQSEFLLN
jgi:putative SOS response-associated peptidase YedK